MHAECRIYIYILYFFSVRVYMMLNDITYISVLFEEGCVADVFNLNITSQNNIATPRPSLQSGKPHAAASHVPVRHACHGSCMKRSAFAKVKGCQGVSLDATLGDDSCNCKSFKYQHPIQVPQMSLGCLSTFNKTMVLLLIDL